MVGSILVVDDDPVLLRILTEGLSKFGHDVQGAANGEEALRLLRRLPFDGALLDYELPDMTGVALYYIMKSFHSRLAQSTIFISGDPRIRSQLPREAVFLEKPFSAADADLALATLLRRAVVRCD